MIPMDSFQFSIFYDSMDLKAHSVPTLCHGLVSSHQLRLPRDPSNLVLSTFRDGVSITSLGSSPRASPLFKKFFPNHSLYHHVTGWKEGLAHTTLACSPY